MGYVFVLAAAVLWGLIGPVSRVALDEGVEPLEIAFWRALLGGTCYALHSLWMRKTRVEGRDVPAVVGFGVVGVALFYGAYLIAVQTGGAALASVLLYTAPAWVAVFSALFLHERMTGRKLAAVALAVAGVAGIAAAGGAAGGVRLTGAAIFWGLLSGWTYALYYLFGKRYFGRYHPSTLFMYALPIGALALLPFLRFSPKSATAWTVLVFLAVVPTYTAYLLYGIGLRRVEATRAATVATIEPVVAAVAAYFAWNERLSVAGYLFSLLVIAAVVLMVTGDGGRTEGEGGEAGTGKGE